jgi:hypothetical protein
MPVSDAGNRGQTPQAQDPAAPGVMAELSLTLGGLREEMHRARCDREAAIARHVANLPIAWSAWGSGVVVAATALVINLGGPSIGRRWVVRQLAVTDAGNVRTAIAGTVIADWYVGEPTPFGGVPAPQQWRATMTPPVIVDKSNEQIVITPTDQLFVVVTGATTAGQQLLATAQVQDFDMVHYKTVTTL